MGNVFYKEESYDKLSAKEKRRLSFYREDIIMIDLGQEGSIGSEQRGYRPAIVIQNNVGNAYSPTLVVALITTKDKADIPTHMNVDLYEPSTIMAEQVRTIDKCRVHKKIGRLKSEYIHRLNHCIAVSMGLTNNFKEESNVQLLQI